MGPADEHLGRSGYTGPRPPVSVVILAHNEERNLAECLLSCAWCDDIHVLDSGSTDPTPRIARQMGAAVHHHPFTSFGEQRNWAIDHIACKYPWQFHLDADERFTAELVAEMAARLGTGEPDAAAFQVAGRMMLLGHWLRHSAGYPIYQVRLIRLGRCRFVDFGHGQREDCSGPIAKLAQPYIHYGFSKGFADWFTKHNRYSSQEAQVGLAQRAGPRPRWRDLVAGDATRRRRALKDLSYRLGGRGLWRFVYSYLLRRGFLDGRAGRIYCGMISVYEGWTELKMREGERPWGRRDAALAAALGGRSVAEHIDELIRRADADSDAWARAGGRAPRPGRPLRRFVATWLLRPGVWRGRAALRVALLAASYEYVLMLLCIEKANAARQRQDVLTATPSTRGGE